MKIVRAIWRSVTTLMLHVSLFALIGAIIFSTYLGNSEAIKSTLKQSNIYSNFIDSVIKTAGKQANLGDSDIPLDDPDIQNLIKGSFSAQSLQENTENFIDSFENWLQGDSDKLTFRFDLSENKEQFASSLSRYAVDRLAGLPDCKNAPSSNNVFLVDCLPDSVNLEQLQISLEQDFLNNSDFLKEAVITEENLPKTSDGYRLDEKLSIAPKIFRILDNGIYIFGAATFVSGALFILARKPRRKGFKALGRDLISNGLMLIIFTVMIGFVLPKYVDSFALNIKGDEVATVGNHAIDIFVRKIDFLIINIAIQIVVVGIIILLIERFTRSSDVYGKAYKKAGMASSVEPKIFDPLTPIKANTAPVQTSEPVHHDVHKVQQKKKKYRKIQL